MEITFDEWFDTKYGKMFSTGQNIAISLTIKKIAKESWEV